MWAGGPGGGSGQGASQGGWGSGWSGQQTWDGSVGSDQTRAAVQAMPHSQVDWAALAQQWIALKDPGPNLNQVNIPRVPLVNNTMHGTPGDSMFLGPSGNGPGPMLGLPRHGVHLQRSQSGPVHGPLTHLNRPPPSFQPGIMLPRQRMPMHSGAMSLGGNSMHRHQLGPMNIPPPNLPPLPLNSQYEGETKPLVPPPPPLVREHDIGVPGEEQGNILNKEGGEENMELEDDQEIDSNPGWGGGSGWSSHNWNVGQSWSEGSNSNSQSNSPEMFRMKSADNSNNTSGSGNMGSLEPKDSKFSGRWTEGRNDFSNASANSLPSLMEVDTSNVASLNEAQRKKLPSWIRAGLEKMERDKLKKEQDEERRRRVEEKKRKARLEEAKLDEDPARSKFDVGSDEEERSRSVPNSPDQKKVRKSRFDESEEVDNEVKSSLSVDVTSESLNIMSPTPAKSKEEILAEMSLNLRKLMTSLLLEVTGEEIDLLASQVLEKARINNNSKPKLQTLLSGYGSENSDSDSDGGPESDQELKSALSKKKKNFKNIQSKILGYCDEETAAYKAREKIWLAGNVESEVTPRSDSKSRSPHKLTASHSSESESSSESSVSQSDVKKAKKSKNGNRKFDTSDSSESAIEDHSKKEKRKSRKSCPSSSRDTTPLKNADKNSSGSKYRKRSKSKSHERNGPSKRRSRSKVKESRRSKTKSRSRDRRRSRSRDRRSRSKRTRSKTRRRGRSRSSTRRRKSRERRRTKSKGRRSRTYSRSRSRKRSKSRSRKKSRRSRSISKYKKRSRSASKRKRNRRSRS